MMKKILRKIEAFMADISYKDSEPTFIIQIKFNKFIKDLIFFYLIKKLIKMYIKGDVL